MKLTKKYDPVTELIRQTVASFGWFQANEVVVHRTKDLKNFEVIYPDPGDVGDHVFLVNRELEQRVPGKKFKISLY